MVPSFLLALREGIEAALMLGLLVGLLQRTRRLECAGSLWLGVASGATVSLIAALALRALGLQLAGHGESIYEGAVGLAAAALLSGMVFWMRRQAASGHDAAGMELRLAGRSCRRAVFALAFVTVVREGVELALFLQMAVLRSTWAAVVTGTMLGLFVAAAAGWMLCTTALRFRVRRFFQVSGALLLLLASGFASNAVGKFVDVGWLPGGIDPLWNTAGWLPETSAGGAMLRIFVGYRSAPSLTEVAVYAGFLLLVIAWGIGSQPEALRSRAAPDFRQGDQTVPQEGERWLR